MLTSFSCFICPLHFEDPAPLPLSFYLAKAIALESLSIEIVRGYRLDQFKNNKRWLFPVRDSKKLSAVKSLRLVNYDWPMAAKSLGIWDFTKLQHLELQWIPLYNFFLHIDLDCLANLRSLKISNRPWTDVLKPFASPDIKKHLWAKLVNLESLAIGSCWEEYFSLDMLPLLTHTLKELDLSLYGINTVREHQPDISIDQLEYILEICPELRYLGLSMDVHKSEKKIVSSSSSRYHK